MNVKRITNFPILLLLLLPGCKTAPMTNTVICRAENLSGHSSALLVERYHHAALNANLFYILIVPDGQDPAQLINSKDIEDLSPFVATNARRVTLNWKNSNTLVVVCDSCGIEAVDISKKLERIGSSTLTYYGFPRHTAYS